MASVPVRVYSSQPPIEEILAIEGIVIVDATPAGSPDVIGNNTVCIVGEFQDMALAVQADPSTGAIRTSCRPDIVYSPADFANKFGGFDSTIGKFGAEMGNGWISVARKPWPAGQLVCAPINLCSAYGTRYWRQLPTNRSATDVNPIIPLSVGVISAGREFRNASNRVKIGTTVTFTADSYYSSGTDGVITPVGLPVATQNFVSASGDFTGATNPARLVTKGDLIVVGSLNGTAGILTSAQTARVRSVTNATTLVLERLDGSNFTTSNWDTAASAPWRIHPARTGDSGGNYILSEVAGYIVPARPLDATIAMATALSPALAPATPSGVVWEPLSGLAGITHPSQPLTYTAAIQAPNAANSSSLDGLYQTAFDALLGEGFPRSQVYAVAASRKSQTIRQILRVHCITSTTNGHPRIGYISPSVNVASLSTVLGDADPGVGANRNEKVLYRYPTLAVFIQECIGVALTGSDGLTYTDGYVDTPADEWALCLRALLAPERDPGQAEAPVPLAFGNIFGYGRGMPAFGNGEYKVAKARGVGLFRIDTPPPQIQSSVTTSLTAGEKDENRRVFADFVEINLGELLKPYIKLPLTDDLKETINGQIEAFFDLLLGPVPQQRIKAYQVDPFSLNTPQTEEQGIYLVKVACRMLAILKDIVLSVSVGPNVEIQLLNN